MAAASASADSYSGKGLVKEVQSGDCLTLLLSGNSELVLTLASLDAPRLSRRNGDAPFAQQSREFLRNLCAGKLVTFKVEYKVPAIDRTFGTVLVNGQDVSLAIVKNGFASVKEVRGAGECSESYDELVALQEQAKDNGKGMWTSDPDQVAKGSKKIRHAGDSDVSTQELAAVFQKIEDKPVDAIIEYVRDGGSLRVQLVDFNLVVPFSLAGVAAPSFRGKGVRRPDGSYDDSDAKPEAFSAMSKKFIESRLLSRRVNIRCCGGPPKVNTFFGKVEHPKGDISAELIKNGLARVSDWTLKFTPNRAALRAAERQAQSQKKRIWKNYTPPDTSAQTTVQGVVVEVNSGDTLTIEDAAGDDHRVTLSSIRVPFAGTRDGAKKPEPFSLEAKEALRTLAIGKRVTAHIEYSRSSRDKDGNERVGVAARSSGTVLSGKQNLAAELVKRGLATTIRHRAGEPRSGSYDVLQDAEIAAEKAQVGVHGKATKASQAPIDVTRDAQKAKQFLSFLTRPGEQIHQGVVDYCFNASRFKVHIPKENVVVAVRLIGVATPRTGSPARNGQPAQASEEYADEAFKFVRRAVLNRTVTVDIEDGDERGSALATIFVNIDGARKNLNLELLKRGYGRVVRWSADKSKLRGQLYDASDAARESKIGVWENYVPRSRETEEGAEEGGATKEGTQRVHVSHINDARSFYITVDDDETTAALASLQTEGPGLAAPEEPVKTKTNYALDFDGEWSRVRVDKLIKEGEGETAVTRADISYIDFGNKEESVDLEELKELPEALRKLPATAVHCHLAFIKPPSLSREYGTTAGTLLRDLTWEKGLVAELLPSDDAGVPVILYDATEVDAAAEAKAGEEAAAAAAAASEEADGEKEEAAAKIPAEAVTSLNEMFVKQGMAKIQRPRQRRGRGSPPSTPKPAKGPHGALQKKLNQLAAAAHKAHVGIWRYGDPGDSDEN